ncbi:6210_t:CDS:2, partial [Gigaspora margarita]
MTPEVPKSFYTLESPKENDDTNQKLEEKTKCNLEENKMEDREIKTKKKEIKNQQKLMDIDLDDKNYGLYKEETPIIITQKNQTREIEEIDQMTLLQETVDEIDAEKDIPKELIELLKAGLNRANTMGLNLQNTEVDNISNLKLRNQNADSAKKNLKPIEDDRTDVQYDPRISCQDKLDLRPTMQGFETKVVRVYEMFDSTQKLDTNKPVEKITVKENKARDLTDQELYYQEEIIKKDEHEAFKSYKRPTEPNEETQVKNRLKTFLYCQKYTEMKHVDKIIECYPKIEANIEPNSTDNLEHTCEVWKKKIEIFKRMIKYPYEPKDSESYKIANTVQDAETSRKDKAQSIQLLQNLKSGYQELK